MVAVQHNMEKQKTELRQNSVLIAALTQHTHTEPGNLFYLVHRSPTEPRRFFLYEQYMDQAALDAHRASPHFAQYAANGLFTILEKREAEIYLPLP
ncbi:MAG TPA: putative quinol monooxygenase [Ktedonobacteraceae bacterium]|nr:putative quinol monooxygenase [Ktedonobacteraceae bacterium]